MREGASHAHLRKLLANIACGAFTLAHAFTRDGFILVVAGPLLL